MFVLDWTDVEQMVAQEWIRRDSYNTCIGRWCRCCPYSCYKRTRLMTIYVLCVSLGFFMILFMAVMGDGLVNPYMHSLSFHNTSCTVVSPVLPSLAGCRCGTRCRSPFPCQGIYVSYATDDGQNLTSLLRRYESTDKCHHDRMCYEKHAEVVDWPSPSDDVLPGDVIDCLFNPDDPLVVIRRRNATPLMLFHLLFWPCVILLACLAGGFVLVYVCGCRYVFVRRAPDDIKREADRRDPFRHMMNMYNNNSFTNMNYTPDATDVISLKNAEDSGTERLFTP